MPKHLIPTLLASLALFLPAVLPAPLRAQQAAAPADAAIAPGAAGSESILPGDVVRLKVLRDKDLSGDFEVNQFGTVVLPLVGEYDVTHETHRTLRDRVIHDLQEIRYAKDIELVVLRRVRIVGEVNKPGVYPLDPTMSIADAVAMAMGRTQLAREGEVVLRRGGRVIDADLRLDEKVSESPVRSGDEILIPRLSWLARNAGPAIGGAFGLVGVIVTLLATK